MDDATMAQYRAVRARYPHIGIKTAVELARYRHTPVLDLEWRGYAQGEYAEWRDHRYGVDVRATWQYDDDPAYTGPELTDDPSSGIRNPHSTVSRYTDDYGRVQLTAPKYLALESGTTVAELAKYNRQTGMARGPAWLQAQRDAQDYARQDADVTYYVCTVTVSIDGVELGSASLGSIGESDNCAEAEAYRAEVASDLLEEAITEARNHMRALREVSL